MFPALTWGRDKRAHAFFSPPEPLLFFTQKGLAGWIVPHYRRVVWLGKFCACIVIAPLSGGRTPPENGLVLAPGSSTRKYLWASARPSAQRFIRLPLRARHIVPRLASDLALWCEGGESPPVRFGVVVPGGDYSLPGRSGVVFPGGTVFLDFIDIMRDTKVWRTCQPKGVSRDDKDYWCGKNGTFL